MKTSTVNITDILGALERSSYNRYLLLDVKSGRHLYVSGDISKLFGMDPTEFMSKTWSELVSMTSGNDSVAQLRNVFAEADSFTRKKGIPHDKMVISLNMNIRQSDGKMRSINHKYIPVKLTPKGDTEMLLTVLSLSTNRDNLSEIVLKDTRNSKAYIWIKGSWNDYKVPKCTPTERKIVDCLVQGRAQKEIASELGCSEKTIKTHCANILKKFKRSNILSAVVRIVHFDLFRK